MKTAKLIAASIMVFILLTAVIGLLLVLSGINPFQPFGNGGAYMQIEVAEYPEKNETVAFENLSENQKRLFVDVLNSEDMDGDVPANVSYNVWLEDRFVEYEDRIYEVNIAVP